MNHAKIDSTYSDTSLILQEFGHIAPSVGYSYWVRIRYARLKTSGVGYSFDLLCGIVGLCFCSSLSILRSINYVQAYTIYIYSFNDFSPCIFCYPTRRPRRPRPTYSTTDQKSFFYSQKIRNRKEIQLKKRTQH